MFIGHYAVAFASKRFAPQVSLGTLFLAAQFLDLLWPVLLLTGMEHVRIDPGNTPVTPLDFYDYPISHSLITTLGWAILIGGVYAVVRKKFSAAIIVALLVTSHWLLDFFTHRPDLPLVPGSHSYFGLGLWYSVPATMIIEGLMFVAGIYLYASKIRAKDKIGLYAFIVLIVFLMATYYVAILGPPPPDEHSLAIGSLFAALIVPWGYWIDRHRMQASINS